MSTDILWHNSVTNETQLWFLDEEKVTGRVTVLGDDGKPAFVGPPWSIVATGDLDLSGGADIVWHNSITNETKIWQMVGRAVRGQITVADKTGPIIVGPPWKIVGTGSFAGGFDSDKGIVWYNTSTGETQVWLMRDLFVEVTGRATVLGDDGKPAFVGPPWSIVGVGDLDVDLLDGIVWHNSSTNETQIWFMDGHQVKRRRTVLGDDGKPAFVGPPWSIVGVSNREIVWHNSSTNETQIWFMEGHQVKRRRTVLGDDGKPAFVGPPWSIVGVNTFSRDPVPLPSGSPK